MKCQERGAYCIEFCIHSMQLWSVLLEWGKQNHVITTKHHRVYHAEIDNPNSKGRWQINYLNEDDATYYIANKKWIYNTICQLMQFKIKDHHIWRCC